jgi:hypothetical protein
MNEEEKQERLEQVKAKIEEMAMQETDEHGPMNRLLNLLTKPGYDGLFGGCNMGSLAGLITGLEQQERLGELRADIEFLIADVVDPKVMTYGCCDYQILDVIGKGVFEPATEIKFMGILMHNRFDKKHEDDAVDLFKKLLLTLPRIKNQDVRRATRGNLEKLRPWVLQILINDETRERDIAKEGRIITFFDEMREKLVKAQDEDARQVMEATLQDLRPQVLEILQKRLEAKRKDLEHAKKMIEELPKEIKKAEKEIKEVTAMATRLNPLAKDGLILEEKKFRVGPAQAEPKKKKQIKTR